MGGQLYYTDKLTCWCFACRERLRQRLQSKEEAVRQGGAQPAGYRGVGGGQEMGMAWSGVM